MCFRAIEPERDVARAKEARDRREHESRRRPPTTRPRGNQEPDRRDLERSAEKLEAVLGR